MIRPAPRTADEAALYLDLHPCPTCQNPDADWRPSETVVDGAPTLRYAGSCAGCGAAREILFELPTVSVPRSVDDLVRYGDARPSRLIDAGEWLAVADLAAQSSDVDTAAGTATPDGIQLLAVATEAMTEILKFIPDDADEVPDSAFWTPEGQRLHRGSRGRFRRRRVALVRDRYRDLLDTLTR
jgi:hypothetical protein